MKLNTLSRVFLLGLISLPLLTSCKDDEDSESNGLGGLTPAEETFGKANDVFSAEEWYPGGNLGTTEYASYSAAAPAVTNISGMEEDNRICKLFCCRSSGHKHLGNGRRL